MRILRLAWIPVAVSLLACTRTSPVEPFALLHVADVVAMRATPARAPALFDANGADFRAREGVISGAVLLSSHDKYDVEKELPAAKGARLVFYCADPH